MAAHNLYFLIRYGGIAMIKSIEINNLFGRFNYHIITKSNGITIITGPNGFGKSTILRIINALSKGNLGFFTGFDFSTIVIFFEGDQKTTIKKRKGEISIDDVKFSSLDEDRSDDIRFLRRPPWLLEVPGGYIDHRNDEFIPEDEWFYRILLERNRYSAHLRSDSSQKNLQQLKNKVLQIKELCGEVRFISDQRLIQPVRERSPEPYIIEVIQELPKQLKQQISKVSEEYSRVANALDSSYPKRLFGAKEGIESQEEYQFRLNEANTKFEKLSKYNLVDMSIIDEENYNSQYSTALKIYFDDFTEKYKVFQDLISKLDLFTKIVNSRLLFKHIEITHDRGFEVVDNENPKKKLLLSQLSSGEKQEIVLFYNLIFNTKEDLLLLIDEPEISLHISWQKKFLDDLIEISKQTKLQVIVATHSPQVISNHLDLQIDLGELYGTELHTKQSK